LEYRSEVEDFGIVQIRRYCWFNDQKRNRDNWKDRSQVCTVTYAEKCCLYFSDRACTVA